MANPLKGEVVKQNFLVIANNPMVAFAPLPIPANPLPGCCNDYVIQVLADNTGNGLTNDTSTIIHRFDAIITTATMVLKQWINGVWTNVANISDNTYGVYGPYGYYTNNSGQKFISLQIDWSKVLNLIGTGSYKVTTTFTSIYGTSSVDSYEFCLRQYSPTLADGTVRLEYNLSGITGDIEDDTKLKDYGTLNVYNTLRVKGYFGYPKSAYKEDTIEYTNGQSLYVEDEQTPTYKMKLFLLPFFIHEIIRTDFMMADTLAVTDYNSKNNAQYVTKYLRKDSGYEPKWYELQSNLASVELQFKQQYNRFRKLRQ